MSDNSDIIQILMPRLSDSMDEGTIAMWLVPDGQMIGGGEDFVEIETDKVTVAYQSPAAGRLRHLISEGDTVAVGDPIAELEPFGQ